MCPVQCLDTLYSSWDCTMTLWLVRHGKTAIPSGTAVGWLDVPLASDGRKQAISLVEKLGHVKISRVIASDLQRARDTATPLVTKRSIPHAKTALSGFHSTKYKCQHGSTTDTGVACSQPSSHDSGNVHPVSAAWSTHRDPLCATTTVPGS